MLDKNPKAAELIAAAALSISTPEPLRDDDDVSEVEDLLVALKADLGIDPGDQSIEARRRLDDALSKALDAFISHEQLHSAQERAGALGLLSPGAYKIILPNSFLEQFRKFGVKDRQVESAINNPDDVQHLLAEEDASERERFSIFLKEFPARGRREKTWLLVQTFRDGMKQIAQAAWWIYPSEVDLSECRNPLDVLIKFANRFGAPLTIAGQTGKFINAIDVPVDQKIKIAVQLPKDFFLSWSTQRTNDPMLGRVGIAYAIDLTEYSRVIKEKS